MKLHVLAGDLARLALEPRRVAPERPPVGVEPPEDPGQPGEPALDAAATLRWAAARRRPWQRSETRCAMMLHGRAERVPLDVEGRAAGAAGRRGEPHALAAGVDRHRQAALGGRLEDRAGSAARRTAAPSRRRGGRGRSAGPRPPGGSPPRPPADPAPGRRSRRAAAARRRASARGSTRCAPARARPPGTGWHQRDETASSPFSTPTSVAARVEQLAPDGLDVGRPAGARLLEVLPEPGGRVGPRVARAARARAPARGTTRAARARRRRGAPPGRRSADGCRSRSRAR